MLFEILSVILTVFFFILGMRRGFIYEFFCIFKYLLVMFLMKYSYSMVKEIPELNGKITKDAANRYLVVFIILYLLFSVILFLCRKFLKSIRLVKYNEILGGILGIIKTTFIIFIIYIFILVGSAYSKRLKEIRNESILVTRMTEYIYSYSQGFPGFIQKEVNSYRRKIKEEEITESVLNAFEKEEENPDKINQLEGWRDED